MSRLVKIKIALVDGDHLIANRKVDDVSGQWERKLNSISPMHRTVTLDRTFERGGITLVIDDHDLAYQTMFKSDTNRRIYDSVVTIYAYKKNGVTLSDTITATIKDWERGVGTVTFHCTQDFAGAMDAIPAGQDLVINAIDFPDAPTRALGKPVLFPTGVVYKHLGRQECWKVIKRNVGLGIDAKYLITKSDPAGVARVTSIDNVYELGVRVLPTSRYELVRGLNGAGTSDGWEYVNYNGDENCIRINLTAVSNPGTAGANPVVALRGVLTAAGVTLVDDGAGGTTDFQDFCTAQTWAMGGVPEGTVTTKDYLETWCQEFNCFWRVDSAGSVHIKHFDWASITADATLTERLFVNFGPEKTQMDSFANRMRSKSGYGNASFETEILTNSPDGDYLPATLPKEKTEQYILAAFGGATTPYAEKLRFFDRAPQRFPGTIDLEHYEDLGLGLLKVVTVTHSRQLGDTGKYLVMDETIDWINETVTIEAMRLWGA